MVIKKSSLIIVSFLLFFGILGSGQFFGLWQLKDDEIGGDTLIIEVANRYNIPLELIYETWNIPTYISPRAELAEARDEAGFSIGRFKIWVTSYVKEHHDLAPAELAALEQSEVDVDDLNISGAFTLEQLSYYFGIPLEEIRQKFSLPQTLPSQTTIRELREEYDLELGEIKIWLQIVSDGLPYYDALQAGEPLNPDHIRQWMTLEQVSQAAGIPLDYLFAGANLPVNPPAELTLGELEEESGFTIEDMRNAMREYDLHEPVTDLAEPQLPSPAPPQFAQPGSPQGSPQTMPQGTPQVNPQGIPQGNPQANPMGTPQGNPQSSPMGTPQADPDNLMPDRDGIRANSTIDQVCEHYNITRAWLLEELDLPATTPGDQSLRSLGVEPGQVRIIMGDYGEQNQ